LISDTKPPQLQSDSFSHPCRLQFAHCASAGRFHYQEKRPPNRNEKSDFHGRNDPGGKGCGVFPFILFGGGLSQLSAVQRFAFGDQN